MDKLKILAEKIKIRNGIDNEIAVLINRPAQIGHLGEYIASEIFNIELNPSASHKGSDGKFNKGSLANKTVNIKWSTKNDGLLNMNLDAPPPDYYLVFTGQKIPAISSRGMTRPLIISNVYLFAALELAEILQGKVKIGVATSVKRNIWAEAEIYPVQRNKHYIMTGEQKEMISLFG